MISFAYPHLLYLLLLIPAIAGLFIWAIWARRNKLERFGQLKVIDHLMPDSSRYMGWIKIVLELLAVFFLVIAIARPYVPSGENETTEDETTSGIEVMICLDVSNSMLASSTDDPNGTSRLQRAKFILEKLINTMSNDKVGLIVFAGDSYTQLPITSDYISAKMFLNDISTDMVPTQGTAIGAAIDMAINSFTPDSDFQRAIIIITDGENFEDNAVEEAKRASEAGIQVDVIGVGTSKGAPIPLNSSRTSFMHDQNGQEVRTALNEQMASEIASAGKGIYVSGNNSSVVNDVHSELDKLAKSEYRRIAAVNPAGELFPIAIIAALVLLLIDMLLPYSKIKWLKDINFFSKK